MAGIHKGEKNYMVSDTQDMSLERDKWLTPEEYHNKTLKEHTIILTTNNGGGKMTEDLFSKGIGTKEHTKALDAKPVVIAGMKSEPVIGKVGGKNAGKEVGKKMILFCKHPDREEAININQMVFVDGKTVKTSTIWVDLDEDGLIAKGSHIARILQKYSLSSLKELEGKTVQTEVGENKFLAIKVY